VEKVKKCPLNRVVKYYLHTIGTVTVIRSREVAAKQGFLKSSGITIAPLQDEVLHICHCRNLWIEEAICVKRKCIVMRTTMLMTQSSFYRTAYLKIY